MVYLERGVRLYLIMLTFLLTMILYGCGGGGSAGPASPVSDAIRSAQVESTVQQPYTNEDSRATSPSTRSVLLNNYNNWHGPNKRDADFNQKIQMLVPRDRITLSEHYSDADINPTMLKAMNPKMKVFGYYSLEMKTTWDSDWNDPSRNDGMVTPLSKKQIDENDWWLRDGDGKVFKISIPTSQEWYIDIGKPGVKEAIVQNLLMRTEGKGFDGFVFDYTGFGIVDRMINSGLKPPPAYKDEDEWFNKAVKPAIEYITREIRARGFKTVGWGELETNNRDFQFARSVNDITIYEGWGVRTNGEFRTPYDTEHMIRVFRQDPKEVWTADFGIRSADPEYQTKANFALTMYYIALPDSPSLREKRFYNHCRDGKVFWDPLWDMNIGQPVESPVKWNGKYFYKRKFSQGLVLLNYGDSEAIDYTLDRSYRNSSGKMVTGTITMPPQTGMILSVE